MAKRKKHVKKQRLAADRPSVDRVTNHEFIKKNLILSPTIRQSVAQGETTQQMLNGQRWLSPLDVLEVYANDPRTKAGYRIEAAKAAAPYRHKKKPTTVEIRDLTEMSNEELRKMADRAKAAMAVNPEDDSQDE